MSTGGALPRPYNRSRGSVRSNFGEVPHLVTSGVRYQTGPYSYREGFSAQSFKRSPVAKMTGHNPEEMEAFQKLSDQYHPAVEVRGLRLQYHLPQH